MSENSIEPRAITPSSNALPESLLETHEAKILYLASVAILAIAFYALAAKYGQLSPFNSHRTGGRNGTTALFLAVFVIHILVRLYVAVRYGLRATFTLRTRAASERYKSLSDLREKVVDTISVPLYALGGMACFDIAFVYFDRRLLARCMIALFLAWGVPFVLVRLYAAIRFGYEGARSLGLPKD